MALDASAALPVWLQSHWQQLMPSLQRGRLSHALLITGPAGVGKRALARSLAAALLCRQPDQHAHACGTCAACQQFAAGSQPDYSVLHPLEAGRDIRVDQVRRFREALYLTAQYDSGRVGLIDPAERLNANAANSLLKVLEEPPAGSHILLITQRPGAVLPTIRSRCQRLHIPLPQPAELAAWLARQTPDVQGAMDFARGAPLQALALAEQDIVARQSDWLDTLEASLARHLTPIDVANRWLQEQDALPTLLDWLYLVIADCLKLVMGAAGSQCVNHKQTDRIRAIAQVLEPAKLARLSSEVTHTRRLLDSNADKQLLLEHLVIDMLRCRKRSQPRRIAQ